MLKRCRRDRWALVLLGAWVLWQQTGTTSLVEQAPHVHQEVRWQILGAFETSPQCGEAGFLFLEERMDDARREGRVARQDKNMIEERFTPRPFGTYAILTRYLCLPETVDPRGPKLPEFKQ